MKAGEIEFVLTADTTQFDKAMRRVRRQLWRTRYLTSFWLPLYAAIVATASLALLILDVTR